MGNDMSGDLGLPRRPRREPHTHPTLVGFPRVLMVMVATLVILVAAAIVAMIGVGHGGS